MLNMVPGLFDGLSYQVQSAIGAKFDKEGTSGAVAGVKFEQEFAAKHGLPEAGAKKGSDFILGEKLARQLGTQKNLQLKLSMFERSKRDATKVVDIASSFSKYLVDILTNNIKTQGLSALVGQGRFKQAMGALNANPQIKKEYIDTGLAKIEFRHFPLDIAALNASKITQCKQDQSLEILESLYSNQNAWVKGNTVEVINDNLKKFIEKEGFYEVEPVCWLNFAYMRPR